jgi:hypothetical protein
MGVIHHSKTTPHGAGDGEQVAIPRGRGSVGDRGAVRAMIVDELFKVGK